MRSVFIVYKNLLDNCKNFPHWQDRIKEEIGTHWAYIYSIHEYSRELDQLYEEFGFDRFYFFK